MGKRSNFERKPRDYYPTPIEAVEPLLPHLPEDFTFAEPCAGNGALIKHLETKGVCVWASDIESQAEGVHNISFEKVGYDELIRSHYVITNPPWDRAILHPLIERFALTIPTWLLFDADWMHTKQSIPYMNLCTKIISVGRIKWFGNMTGKDNCAWYLFQRPSHPKGTTKFYGRT